MIGRPMKSPGGTFRGKKKPIQLFIKKVIGQVAAKFAEGTKQKANIKNRETNEKSWGNLPRKPAILLKKRSNHQK